MARVYVAEKKEIYIDARRKAKLLDVYFTLLLVLYIIARVSNLQFF